MEQAIYHQGMPFEIKIKTANTTTIKAMEMSENNEDMYGPFDSVSDLMEALNA